MQFELWSEEVHQELNIEQLPADGVVLRDGIAELDPIVEEVGEVIVREIDQRVQVLALALLDCCSGGPTS